MEVCHKLWNNWEPDAVVADKESGMYVDPSKVHPINHKGKWFSCPGISPVSPSPQGHPVLFQAGASGAGRDFCAKHAEAAFGVQLTTRAMKSYADDMRIRVKHQGRDPESLKFIWGVQAIVGGTEEEALQKQQDLNDRVPVEGVRGLFEIFTKMYKSGDLGRGKLTMRDIGKIYGATIGCPQIVGTPEQAADQMEAIIDETGGDGFNSTPSTMPGSLTEFVDGVVPILQKRGLHRAEYTGQTYREHLQQEMCG